MTPEQLAIKNVGKQVRSCRSKRFIIVLIWIYFSSVTFARLLSGSKETPGGTRGRLDDVQHRSVPGGHVGYRGFPVILLLACIIVNIAALVSFI